MLGARHREGQVLRPDSGSRQAVLDGERGPARVQVDALLPREPLLLDRHDDLVTVHEARAAVVRRTYPQDPRLAHAAPPARGDPKARARAGLSTSIVWIASGGKPSRTASGRKCSRM